MFRHYGNSTLPCAHCTRLMCVTHDKANTAKKPSAKSALSCAGVPYFAHTTKDFCKKAKKLEKNKKGFFFLRRRHQTIHSSSPLSCLILQNFRTLCKKGVGKAGFAVCLILDTHKVFF